ncbi:unnamed protein product [Allacma fusca]|uniref:Uncharacterized protein n=1 Tax=Allacma fusca TaxID=39272 RepID=A0A8J2K5H6_9HEXA|nr:unnamed protein product [Allacma fusca]
MCLDREDLSDTTETMSSNNQKLSTTERVIKRGGGDLDVRDVRVKNSRDLETKINRESGRLYCRVVGGWKATRKKPRDEALGKLSDFCFNPGPCSRKAEQIALLQLTSKLR